MANTYEFNGLNLTIAQWSDLNGIKKSILKTRLQRAGSDPAKIAKAITDGASAEFLEAIKDFDKETDEEPKVSDFGKVIESAKQDEADLTATEAIKEEEPAKHKKVPKTVSKTDATLVFRLASGSYKITRRFDGAVETKKGADKVSSHKVLLEIIQELKIEVDNIEKKNTQSLGRIVFKHMENANV